MDTPLHPLNSLRSVIEFAQMDLQNLKGAELKAVEQRVRDLIKWQRHGWVRAPALNRALLLELQSQSLKFLTEIVEVGTDEVELTLKFWAARDLKPRVSQTSRADRDPHAYESKVGVVVDGAPRDRLLYLIIQLLEELGAEKLRTCADPECGRLFFKVTRKEFCSTRCQSRVYMRTYRDVDTDKELRRGKTKRTRRR